MAVSAEYREFVLEQMGRVAPVTSRSMFGGVGVYSDGFFFALLAGDATWLKVDDSNRGDFERAGTGPFAPFGDTEHVMQYYELPADLLEDADALAPWIHKALDVARSARRRKQR